MLSDEVIEKELRKRRGNMAAVGRAMGVTRQAILQHVNASPELRAVFEECRESMKDTAEAALQKAIRKGEGWAICFFLKTQAKDRGYVERQEITGIEGGPLTVKHGVDLSRLSREQLLQLRGIVGAASGGATSERNGHAAHNGAS